MSEKQRTHARRPGTQSTTPGSSVWTRSSGGTAQPASLVLLNTGDGKGKSTAAFGVVMRALAQGWHVEVIQFVKSAGWQSGEEAILRQLGVEWTKGGAGFTWVDKAGCCSQDMARAAWDMAARELSREDLDLLVLDEITLPVSLGWLDEGAVLEAVRARSPRLNVILTGRGAPATFLELADTVTEMRNVRHPFERGIVARAGIDY